MNKKGIFLLIIILSFSSYLGAYEFDEIIDFSAGLIELDTMLQEGRANLVDKNKYYIINGTLSDVNPRIISKQPYFFLLFEKDIKDTASFMKKIALANTPLTSFLKTCLTEDTLTMLNGYSIGSIPSSELLNAVLNDINEFIQTQNIYNSDNFVTISEELKKIAEFELTGQEEITFCNRLLLEEAFPEDIKKVRVQIELVLGEWIGMEEVKSYRGLIYFEGPEAFKIFHRRKEKDASSLWIPLNSKILIVVRPVDIVEMSDNQVWLFEGYHIRHIK
jgi:hypothetical protein